MKKINFSYKTKNNSRIGYEKSYYQNNFSSHIHDYFEMLYLIEGNITYGTDTFYRQVLSNSLIITPMNSFHNVRSNDGLLYERMVVEVNDKTISALLQQKFGKNHIILSLSNQTFLKQLFQSFLHYNAIKDQLQPAQYEKIIRNLIEAIGINVSLIQQTEEDNSTTVFNSPFLNIVSFIDENITSVNVNDLAQKFSVSTTYIYKLFQNNMGISPKKYILDKKLAFAKNLIDAGAKRTEVAIKCGYTEYAAFYRVYKKFLLKMKKNSLP